MFSKKVKKGYVLYQNENGPEIGTSKDLAARLPVEMIAGLMLYSPHQMVPGMPDSPFPGKYKGKDFPDSGCEPWEMSDQQ